MSHPNASVSSVASLLAAGTVWLLDRYAHASLTGTDGVAIAGLFSASALFVGRRGIKRTLVQLWRGGAEPANDAESHGA